MVHLLSTNIQVVLLKSADQTLLQRLAAGVRDLRLGPGQDSFVGVPAVMLAAAMSDPARHPFAVLAGAAAAAVVGMGVLQVGAAKDAGWPHADGAVLLRGFLIDKGCQGLGYGSGAAVAAVELAEALVRASGLSATGVVLSVNERNPVGLAAYVKAGFADRGQYLGGRAGPQRILYRGFDAVPAVNPS